MSNRTESNGSPSLTDRVKELRLTGKLGGDSPRGAGGTSWFPWLLCFFLAIGWAVYGIKAFKPVAKPQDAIATPQSGTGTSSAANISDPSSTEAVMLEVKGYLIPTQQVSVSPIDVAGKVVKLNIEEGMSFKRDAVLAEIDPTPFLRQKAENVAQVAGAKAKLAELEKGSRPEEIDQAQAELDDAKALLEQFRREWQRYESQKSSAITTREYEQAEAGYRSALKRVEARQKAYDLVKSGPRRERIDAAKAELEAAAARLSQTEWRLQNCTIRSPLTGVILTKKAEVGSLINPVVGGVSTNLCDIADLRKLEVDLEVQERDIAKINLDQVCKIRPDAFPNRIYEGYVERIMPTANRAKSIVPVRIKVVPKDDEKQGQYLRPEMGVTVTFVNKQVTQEYKNAVRKRLDDDSDSSIGQNK